MSKINDKRKRISRILRNIRRRDAMIKQGKRPIRRVGSRKERLFVRAGFFSKLIRKRDLRNIRRDSKGRFMAKIGGPKRGTVRRFKSKSSARRAVIRHHDKILIARLGKRGAQRAKRVFNF